MQSRFITLACALAAFAPAHSPAWAMQAPTETEISQPQSTASPAPPPADTPAPQAAVPSASETPSETPLSEAPLQPAAEDAERPQESELLGASVRRQLDTLPALTSDADRQDVAALKTFYEERNDEPLWIKDDALTEKAKATIDEIQKAGDWGLDASAFALPEVKAGTLTREEAADAEMTLSLAALKYARHARGGRIADPAKQLSSYLDRMPQLVDPKVVLERIAASSDPDAVLRQMHPQHPQFEKLRQRYLELKKSADAAEAIVRLPKGPTLSPGQRHAHVALLRQRLGAPTPTASEDNSADETLFDEALAQAVKDYQKSKGLRPDGIVGNATRNALNAVETPSPLKILANMEQWRWMPDDLGSYFVTVNIPEFMIRVIKDGTLIHEERVIIGTTSHQTPVFSSEMELVTIHPRWFVPNSIKVRELYPSLVAGGNPIARQGLVLSQNGRPVNPELIDWSRTDIRKFDVYQPSGSRNALGVVKLMFPNKHIVYFHDTPSKGLFNESTRTFSHGCIRVRNPIKLAELILREDKGWDEARVQALFAAKPNENPIALDRKVPVHITYFTVWIDDEGKEQTARDIYGHEKRIMQALEGRFSEIARGRDHLAPVSYAEVRTIQQKHQQSFGGFLNSLFGGF